MAHASQSRLLRYGVCLAINGLVFFAPFFRCQLDNQNKILKENCLLLAMALMVYPLDFLLVIRRRKTRRAKQNNLYFKGLQKWLFQCTKFQDLPVCSLGMGRD